MAKQWPVQLIRLVRAMTAGLAYYFVIDIPGLTSSMVAIFVAVLLFDLMISLEEVRGGWSVWKGVVKIVIPHAAATALTLVYGLAIGGIAALSVYFGMPVFVGAILTVGLSYSIAERTPNRTSRSVGIVGGLAVFDKTYRIATTREFFIQAGPVIVSTIYGTFAALIVGWTIGILLGFLTRLLLPRGYKSVLSSAYDRPLMLRPVQEVLHLDEDYLLTTIEVGVGAEMEGRSLAAADLRQRCEAWVLRLDREGTKTSLPGGEDKLQAGDMLLVYLPKLRKADLEQLFEPRASGVVEPFPLNTSQ